MRKGDRGKQGKRHRRESIRTASITGAFNDKGKMVGLNAKVISDAPPEFRGRVGMITNVKGRRAKLSFNDGRYGSELSISIRGLAVIVRADKQPDGTLVGRAVKIKGD